MKIRDADRSDAAAVGAIYLVSRRTFLPYAPLAHDEADVREWIETVLLPASGTRIACEDGRPVGFCSSSVDGEGVAWIDQLYLEPGRTGVGGGARLLLDALERLPRPVRLWSFQRNTGARRFYARFGFREVRFTDGEENEERCPDVLLELPRAQRSRSRGPGDDRVGRCSRG